MIGRRSLLAGLLAAPLASRVDAQDFPARPITIVVPYPAGGPVDVVARLLAKETELPQPLVVDNRAGGSGVIGTAAVARAEPDGHTLVLGTNQTHAANQALVKDIAYDAVRDFAPVVGIAEIPHVLVVRKDLPAADAAALVRLAKERPGALNYGSTGNASASHLAGELFKARTGATMQHVPFRGAAPMLQELVAGRIDLSFATLPSVIAQIEAGAIRALAVASEKRAPRLPNVPTLAEAGIAGVEADAWFALFAPARTPGAAIDRLDRAVAGALNKPATRAALEAQGMSVAVRSPSELAASLPGEVEKWAAVIRAAGIKAE